MRDRATANWKKAPGRTEISGFVDVAQKMSSVELEKNWGFRSDTTYLYSLYSPENMYTLGISSLLHPGVLFAVVRDAAGAAVGCGAIVMKPGYGEIKRVCVRPQARGRGLARRLIETLEEKAVEQGCRTFMLETGATMPEALILYERLGYQYRGPFDDYPDDPLSVFMQKGRNLTVMASTRFATPENERNG